MGAVWTHDCAEESRKDGARCRSRGGEKVSWAWGLGWLGGLGGLGGPGIGILCAHDEVLCQGELFDVGIRKAF